MDIQVGDRVTYKLKLTNEIKTIIIEHIDAINNFNDDLHYEVLKIERPKYEVIEEKKELLTEEEREFLKYYIKLLNITNNNVDFIENSGTYIYIYTKDNDFYRADINNQFNNLEEDKEYTLSELGLED